VIAAETGTPLRRAQVRLIGTNAGAGPAYNQLANTDGEGRYEFTRLPAARYTLSVSRTGYVSLQFGQQRPFEPGKPLTLTDGQVMDKIDFALPKGGVIVGKITDDSGEPLAGVMLQAQRYQYVPGGQRRLVFSGQPQVMTDDLGQFRIYGLMPAAYVISAMPPRGMMMFVNPGGDIGGSNAGDGFATTYFPGSANPDDAQTINVQLGQEATAFFSMVSARMSRISGTIRTSQGNRPSGRMSVSLRSSMGAVGFMTNMSGGVSEDGSFSIGNVPPGDHFIDVRPMMMGPPLPGAQASASESEFASVPITVSGQDIQGLVITTGVGANISGHVTFDGTSARPQSPQPLRVFPTSADPSIPGMPFASSQDNGAVDDEGRFQLRGINGNVLFRLGAQGWNLKSVTLNGVDITDTPYEARPSTNVSGLEIVLTDRVTTITGTVKNSQGQAVKEYVVVFFPADGRPGLLASRFIRSVRPDQDGRYQMRGLPPGDYIAAAVESLEQGQEWDPALQEALKPSGRALRLNEGESLTLDLELPR